MCHRACQKHCVCFVEGKRPCLALSPSLSLCRSQLREKGSQRVISLDGTFKVLTSVQEQRQHGRRASGDAGAGLHIAVTARTEDAPRICSRLSLVPGVTEQLQCLTTDRPLEWDGRATFDIFHKLHCGRPCAPRLSRVAAFLEVVLSSSPSPPACAGYKKIDDQVGASRKDPVITRGCTVRTAREHGVSLVRLSKTRARAVLDSVHPTAPFQSCIEFVRLLVAAIAFTETSGATVTSCGRDRTRLCVEGIECLAKVQNSITRQELSLGTTGNETGPSRPQELGAQRAPPDVGSGSHHHGFAGLVRGAGTRVGGEVRAGGGVGGPVFLLHTIV